VRSAPSPRTFLVTTARAHAYFHNPMGPTCPPVTYLFLPTPTTYEAPFIEFLVTLTTQRYSPRIQSVQHPWRSYSLLALSRSFRTRQQEACIRLFPKRSALPQSQAPHPRNNLPAFPRCPPLLSSRLHRTAGSTVRWIPGGLDRFCLSPYCMR